jgi:hypothetical protein
MQKGRQLKRPGQTCMQASTQGHAQTSEHRLKLESALAASQLPQHTLHLIQKQEVIQKQEITNT